MKFGGIGYILFLELGSGYMGVFLKLDRWVIYNLWVWYFFYNKIKINGKRVYFIKKLWDLYLFGFVSLFLSNKYL